MAQNNKISNQKITPKGNNSAPSMAMMMINDISTISFSALYIRCAVMVNPCDSTKLNGAIMSDSNVPYLWIDSFICDSNIPKLWIGSFIGDSNVPKLWIGSFMSDSNIPKVRNDRFMSDSNVPKIRNDRFMSDSNIPKVRNDRFNDNSNSNYKIK